MHPPLTPVQLIVIILVLAVVRLVFAFRIKLLDSLLNENRKKTLKEYLDSFIIAGITALILIHYVVRTFYIPSGSMIPTLQVGDLILVNEIGYRLYHPHRGDIVVFHPPPEAGENDKDFIKRLIAAGGDTVEVKDGIVYVNDKPLTEPYINERPFLDMPRIKIEPGFYFVMGDNRNNSYDSRAWGKLPAGNVVGKAMIVFWPPGRMRVLR